MSAGDEVLKYYQNDYSDNIKQKGEPVTKADIESNKVILSQLLELNIPVVSEESSDDGSRLESEKVWIVDPLDGTRDFIQKTDEFSVMIALVKKNIPVIGIVYQPVFKRLYVSCKNLGAYVFEEGEWKRLRVSHTATLDKARAVMSKMHLEKKEKDFLKKLGINSVVQKGSTGLKIGEIAKGSADIYFTFTDKMKQWDTAAGFSIITEAGGKITNIYGSSLKYNTVRLHHDNGMLVTNGFLHSIFLKVKNNT
ncbi:MAG: 3'(2'),5'-bisphosphate nucleotidase CysQ [Candidatus Levybacteria bacterium CG10_big_fil_rev_8_21_14_0_10_36_7]|nr:MAG: 3'(2'),5'-bisphosphate nucleotidase CysQ [Candidatus Levybacteria bacterium CG10_big_fil_rev_8_21_14_0_10_36_7]